jgi:hypothetical protein
MHQLSLKLIALASFLAGSALPLPAIALAAPVPPGNSAATQYTEAYHTSGGQQNAENGKGRKHRNPEQVLGKENAQRLESQGAAGEAVAALAAETAPDGSKAAAGGGRSGRDQAKDAGKMRSHSGGSDSRSDEGPGGNSALDEVASQATGSSWDGVDLLLPLAILGSLIWLLVYLLRRRRQAA